MRYIVLVLSLCFFACNQKVEDKPKNEYLRQVGDIPFDSELDDPKFKPCNEELATVHYAFDNPNGYEGEKPAIVEAFRSISSKKDPEATGYITIRFMVNCNGETGRFRVEQLDNDYKPKKFNESFVADILSTTKSLDGWIPATYKDRKFDYYKYLTFKITILPTSSNNRGPISLGISWSASRFGVC